MHGDGWDNLMFDDFYDAESCFLSRGLPAPETIIYVAGLPYYFDTTNKVYRMEQFRER